VLQWTVNDCVCLQTLDEAQRASVLLELLAAGSYQLSADVSLETVSQRCPVSLKSRHWCQAGTETPAQRPSKTSTKVAQLMTRVLQVNLSCLLERVYSKLSK